MSKMVKVQATIPLDSDWSVDDLDKKAEELGLSRSRFIIEAINLLMGLESDSLEYLKMYSKGVGVSVPEVLQAIVVNRQADEEAQLEVYGKVTSHLLEFTRHYPEGSTVSKFDESKKVPIGIPELMKGKELKEFLKPVYVQEYEQIKNMKDLRNERQKVDYKEHESECKLKGANLLAKKENS